VAALTVARLDIIEEIAELGVRTEKGDTETSFALGYRH